MVVADSLGLQLVLKRMRVMPHQSNLPKSLWARGEEPNLANMPEWGEAYGCTIHQGLSGLAHRASNFKPEGSYTQTLFSPLGLIFEVGLFLPQRLGKSARFGIGARPGVSDLRGRFQRKLRRSLLRFTSGDLKGSQWTSPLLPMAKPRRSRSGE